MFLNIQFSESYSDLWGQPLCFGNHIAAHILLTDKLFSQKRIVLRNRLNVRTIDKKLGNLYMVHSLHYDTTGDSFSVFQAIGFVRRNSPPPDEPAISHVFSGGMPFQWTF